MILEYASISGAMVVPVVLVISSTTYIQHEASLISRDFFFATPFASSQVVNRWTPLIVHTNPPTRSRYVKLTNISVL